MTCYLIIEIPVNITEHIYGKKFLAHKVGYGHLKKGYVIGETSGGYERMKHRRGGFPVLEELMQINWSLIAPIIVIQLILMIVAIIDLVRIEETNGPKWLWAIIIVFVNVLGPILYFILGRRQ